MYAIFFAMYVKLIRVGVIGTGSRPPTIITTPLPLHPGAVLNHFTSELEKKLCGGRIVLLKV